MMSAEEYNNMIYTILMSVSHEESGFHNFSNGDSVIEFGCGAGAFLSSLDQLTQNHVGIKLDLYGIDYSESLIEIANERLGKQAGWGQDHFWTADVTNVQFLPNNSFDHSVSVGVLFYLDTYDQVLDSIREMVRIIKPGGSLILMDISDKKFEQQALKARSESSGYYHSSSHKKAAVSTYTPPHLYIPKSLFLDNANALGIQIHNIVDEKDLALDNYEMSKYRYTVLATKF